jgi:hypothetical protein
MALEAQHLYDPDTRPESGEQSTCSDFDSHTANGSHHNQALITDRVEASCAERQVSYAHVEKDPDVPYWRTSMQIM